MRRRVARRLVDTARIHTVTTSVDVDPTTLQPDTTNSDPWEGPALFRQDIVERIPGEGRVYGERVLAVKLADTACPSTGDRLEIVTCTGDPTLDGKYGTIVDVDRDTIRCTRRVTVRMDNSK